MMGIHVEGIFSKTGNNVSLTVGTTSANVATNPPGSLGGVARLVNVGANLVHIEFGNSSVTATIPDGIPIGPNSEVLLDWPPGATHVAAIAGATGNTLHIQPGIGI